jgi:uncharacterized protein YjiK
MTVARGLALIAAIVACAGSCRETPQAQAEQQRALDALEVARSHQLARRIAIADSSPRQAGPLAMWILPQELREISGLTLTSDDRMLAHDDENTTIYQINPKTGIVIKRFALDGNPTGDYEAIAAAGTDLYLLESNGKLLAFQEGAEDARVPFTRYDTRLGKECTFESLAYEPDSSRLLLACKGVSAKGLKNKLVIYRLPLPITSSSTLSLLTIPMASVIGLNGWRDFQPSDMAIDPATGNYVIVASQQKAIVVITPGGKVVRSEPLPGIHQQAEGVAITRDGILIVSDEARHKPAAITLYRWRP